MITFGGLEERTRQFAGGLAGLGHRRGAPVMICLPAGIDAVVALLGTVRAAGVGVPVNPRSSTAEIARYTEDCQPVLTVTSVADVLAAATGEPPRDDLGLDEDCWIHYTSGSTGRPKGVVSSQGSWLSMLELSLVRHLGLRSDDRLLWPLPLFHALGHGRCVLAVPLLAVLNSGIRSLLSEADEHVDPEDVHTSEPEETGPDEPDLQRQRDLTS